MQKVKLPRSKFASYAIVLMALIFAGFFSFVLAQISVPDKPQSAVKATKVIKSKVSPSPTQEVENLVNNSATKAPIVSGQPLPQSTVTTNNNSSTGSSNNSSGSSSPTPTSAPATVNASENKVTVSINGASGFEVKVDNGANQCDVLTKSVEQGKIQSLNMRYDNSLGSNGVYQINGIGKDNTVWWTYKINGQAPTQGCSYIKANNGDNVEWKYIGS